MHLALKHLPSFSMGEGAGGGGSRASSPHPHLPPPRGEGVLTSPCGSLVEEDWGVRLPL
jgi:hypothetical protein